jgi:hypothetical protein
MERPTSRMTSRTRAGRRADIAHLLQSSTAAQVSAWTEHDKFHGSGLVWALAHTSEHVALSGVGVAHEHPRFFPCKQTLAHVAAAGFGHGFVSTGQGVVVAQPGASAIRSATRNPTAEIQRVAFTLAS